MLLRRFDLNRGFALNQSLVPLVIDRGWVLKSLLAHLAIVTARMLASRVSHEAVASGVAVLQCISMAMDMADRFRLDLLSALMGHARSRVAAASPHIADA